MAQIITIANNKGGCGKTTTAVNLAAALKLAGASVLLVDLDGQMNATFALKAEPDRGTFDYLLRPRSGRPVPSEDRYADIVPPGRLDVLPACADLSTLEMQLAKKPDDIVERLKALLDSYDQYDVIVIDTPPSMGVLTTSALYAADLVIFTLEPEYFALRGLTVIQGALEKVEAFKGTSIPWAILLTKVDRRKGLHNQVIEYARSSDMVILDTVIRSNVSLGEAPLSGEDIFTYAPKSRGAEDYKAAAIEIINRFSLQDKIRRG